MSDRIVLGLCIVLEKNEWSVNGDYQFNLVDKMHVAFPPAKPIDPNESPFVVMTAESYNLMQQAIDNTGERDKLRNELIRVRGGVVVKVSSNHVARFDDPFLLNKVGLAWKAYAQELDRNLTPDGTDSGRQIELAAARQALKDLIGDDLEK